MAEIELAEPGVFALKHESKIIRQCWDAQKFTTSCFSFSNQFLSTLLVCGATPTNWIEGKWQFSIHPSNG